MEGPRQEDQGSNASQPKPGPVETGRIGRYQLQGELGRGAMGVVYLATDPAIGRRVAIKTIRIRDINNQAQQQKLRERLFREARSAGVLSHPNIVTIYDMDEDDGVAYIAMEFVNGPTLDHVLSSGTPMAGAEMLRILRQSASALDYAHGRGVIHRDVKPGNIMLDENGAVRITDFGIAKLTAPTNTTETRSVTGTPSYMSPEQVQGMVVDGKSDQFSLAVIAYEILAGERPFHGEHLSTIVYRIVAEQPVESHRINSTLTSKIDGVLRKAMAKQREERFPNCASFVGALELACAESRGWKAIPSGSGHTLETSASEVAVPPRVAQTPLLNTPPRGNPSKPTRPTAASAPPDFAEPERVTRSSSRVWPVVAGLLVALGLGGVFAWEAGVIPGFDFSLRAPDTASQTAVRPPASNPTPSEPVIAPPVTPPDVNPPELTSPPASPPPPVEQKPSPVGSTPADAAEAARGQGAVGGQTARAARTRAQDIWIATNPPGAKVVLDDDLGGACFAPCMLHAPAGVHNLNYSLAGYQNEYREIRIGETAIDAPLVSLRQPGGMLLLTTAPAGASIRVDGKPVAGTTPAQIPLPPGPHSVTVERGGRSQTQQVDIQESPVYLRFTLGP